MFTWSWAIIMVVIGFVLIAIITFDDLRYRAEYRHRRGHEEPGLTPGKETLVFFIVMMLTAGVVWNVANAAISGRSGTDTPRHVSDIAVAKELFGFESGKTYPLVLGSQVSTMSMQMNSNMSSGFFFTTMETSVSGEGGPAITISYTHDDSTYALSLLRDSTIIHLDDAKPPSVTVELVNANAADAYNESTWGDCHWVISNLAAARQCTLTYSDEIKFHSNVRKTGLSWLVKRTFASAEITMTHNMFNQLIGGIK